MAKYFKCFNCRKEISYDEVVMLCPLCESGAVRAIRPTFYDLVYELICKLLDEYTKETPFHDRWNYITDVKTNDIRVGRGQDAVNLLRDLLDDYPTHHKYPD